MTKKTNGEQKVIYRQGAAMEGFIVDTTIEVCKARTVNYNPIDFPGDGPDQMDMPGHESRVVDILEPILSGWGIDHHREARAPERPSLFASIGQKAPGARRLMFLLHTDTVPSGEQKDWKFPPFETHANKGKLYGRGVLDNKGPMVASLAAFKILKDHEHRIPGEVVFAAIADEEVQAGYGLDWLLDNDKISCDEAIVPDIAGEMKEINVAEKGRVKLRIIVRGKAAHAMQPDKGVSAIYGLAAVLQKLEKMKMPHPKHSILSSPTLNVGIIRGGSAPNAVADRAEVTVDIRYVPGQRPAAIQKQLRELCKQVASKRPGLRFGIELDDSALPIAVKPEAPLVQAILRHVPEAKIVGTGGGTFAHPLVERGIHAVGWSPGNERTYHQPNEEIPIKQLTTFAGRLAALTLDRMNEA